MHEIYLEADGGDPADDALVGPDEHVATLIVAVGLASALLEQAPVVVEALQEQRAVLKARPVEGIDHLELAAQLALRQVVQHASVHQRLHEGRPVLGEAERRKPIVADPRVVHVAKGERRARRPRRRRRRQRHHLLDGQSQLQPMQRVTVLNTQTNVVQDAFCHFLRGNYSTLSPYFYDVIIPLFLVLLCNSR